MTHRDDASAQELGPSEPLARGPVEGAAYESPVIVDLGSVREVTQGSAKNGECDATTQYYN
jgi:hypothetical protein